MSDALTSVVGGWTTTHDAEHAFHGAWDDLEHSGAFACTMFPAPGEVAIVVSGSASALPNGARAFVFPGHHRLVGEVSVHELVSGSAITHVRGIGGAELPAHALVDTQGFIRPHVDGGRLLLLTRPAGEGRLVPFEQPHPTPCCVDHA